MPDISDPGQSGGGPWRRLVLTVLLLAALTGLALWGVTSFMFGYEVAHWRFTECNCSFGVTVANWRCRAPVLWVYSGVLEVASAMGIAVGLGVRWVLHRRRRRLAGRQ